MSAGCPTSHDRSGERGVALIVALLITFVLAALLTAYSVLTMGEAKLAVSSTDSIHGQLAAEAGVNLRAAAIREDFMMWNRPKGTPPADPAAGELPCSQKTGSGTGAYQCVTYPFADRSALTYVREEPGNPKNIRIPPGERFAGLKASEYRYTVSSTAVNTDGFPEAILDMRWKTRVVPVFQFFAFYNGDLENNPGPAMTIDGPMHANGDIFLSCTDKLHINSEVSAMRGIWRGRKYDASATQCKSGTVWFHDGAGFVETPRCNVTGRREVTNLDPWNGRVTNYGDAVEVPPVEDMDPTPGSRYWDLADLRIVLHIYDQNGINGIETHERFVEVRNPDNTINGPATLALVGSSIGDARNGGSAACDGKFGRANGRPPAVHWTNKKTWMLTPDRWKNASNSQYRSGIQNWRHVYAGMAGVGMYNSSNEAWTETLEVDMRRLLRCIHDNPQIMGGKALDDDSQGGLVFYFGVDGPLSKTVNNYGFRVENGAQLWAHGDVGPKPKGLTIVSDQSGYIKGDYNDTYGNANSYNLSDSTWISSAFLVDTFFLLSNNWRDDPYSNQASRYDRQALNTAYRVAVMQGLLPTGGANGPPPAGWDGGKPPGPLGKNGGLNNFPIMLESWKDPAERTSRMQTSFVTIAAPRYDISTSTGTADYRRPGVREWSFDNRFEDPANLPPMTPQFTYSRQEMYTRNFEW
jgi:hypothetical protein